MEKRINTALKILENKVGKRFAKEIICIILLIFGIKPKEIKDGMKTTYKTIRKYRENIENDKIEEIFEDRVYRKTSLLDEYAEIIEAEFEAKPPKALREAAERIAKLTGIKRTIQCIGKYLKKKG